MVYYRQISKGALCTSGFAVGKYISLEMLIENSKSEYYEALHTSSDLWHENANDAKPFVAYILGIVLKAYRELESRVEGVVNARMGKAERIRAVFSSSLGKITKKDILLKCPDVSVAMVELTLKAMLDDGSIRKIGNGRATAYVRNDES